MKNEEIRAKIFDFQKQLVALNEDDRKFVVNDVLLDPTDEFDNLCIRRIKQVMKDEISIKIDQLVNFLNTYKDE